MANLNLVQLIGRCGQDPEMRFTPNGEPVTTFSMAVNRYSGNGEQQKEHTDWFNIVTWNRLAEVCNQYLAKGSLVYVQGRLQVRSWEDAGGTKKQRTEVVGGKVQFLNGRESYARDDGGDNDLPF